MTWSLWPTPGQLYLQEECFTEFKDLKFAGPSLDFKGRFRELSIKLSKIWSRYHLHNALLPFNFSILSNRHRSPSQPALRDRSTFISTSGCKTLAITVVFVVVGSFHFPSTGIISYCNTIIDATAKTSAVASAVRDTYSCHHSRGGMLRHGAWLTFAALLREVGGVKVVNRVSP